MGRAIKNKSFEFPQPKSLPDSNIVLPYVILGDEAFPLLENLMKPYPRPQSLSDRTKAIFNYRLSRARRIVENTFGIMTHRFRVFSSPINLNIETVENLVSSACILHNAIIDATLDQNATNTDISPSSLNSLNTSCGEIDVGTNEPHNVRDKFKDYFNTIGSVSWQNETIRL